MLNTRIYDVLFPDGSVRQYAANIIAENLYSQVDDEGFRYQLLDEIIDHKTDEQAISKGDGFVYTQSGQKRRRMTTKGWWFLVSWKDGDQSWVPLKDLKESFPIHLQNIP